MPGWVTWGYDVERHGVNPNESTIGVDNVGKLKQAWSVDVGGHVNTAAMVANGVRANGTTADVAYVGTEHGGFFAIDIKDGRILWKKQFPPSASSARSHPTGSSGSAPPPSSTRVRSGSMRRRWTARSTRRGPVHRRGDVGLAGRRRRRREDRLRVGRATLWKGQLYVGTASHCEIGPHEGRVLSIDTAKATKSHVFWVTGHRASDRRQRVGVGRRVGRSQDRRRLRRVRAGEELSGERALRRSRPAPDGRPAAARRPRTARPPGLFDDDFGSTPVLFQRDGCPPQLAVMRKQGTLYLYDRDSIAKGPSQTVNMSGSPYQFIGVPAFWSAENLLYVANPSPGPDENYTHGMVAFRLGSNCRLKVAWQQTAGRNDTVVSAPTIANGVVYYGDGTGNQIHAFDAKSGKPLWSSPPNDLQDRGVHRPGGRERHLAPRVVGQPPARLPTVGTVSPALPSPRGV